MNIKLLDSWLKDYLKTDATAAKIAENLSLTSVSVERVEKYGTDHVYDIEITTNRPDLMSVIGLVREAAAVLPQFGIKARFTEPVFKQIAGSGDLEIKIENDPKLVNRICAVALDINLKPSPKEISERLETSDIRSINNAVDVTNYVMREVGHPMHVFDYDKLLKTGKMIVRLSKEGETIKTLDGKEYKLAGGDIVIDNGTGEIIDLMAVMGTLNSAVDDNTKRIMLFVDNCNQHKIRKTSMNLAIRSEAAILNEKGVDRELALPAILRGVELLKEIGEAKVISEIVDIYPNKLSPRTVEVTQKKINAVMGVDLEIKTSIEILQNLGFKVTSKDDLLKVAVPSWRIDDVTLPEDIIEEVARVYGYFKLPSILPYQTEQIPYSRANDQFYWEQRAREALKYWGFTELFTYPMVSESMLEGPISEAVTIKNPLSEDNVHMRRTLVPSLLEAVRENKNRETLAIFEISNAYIKQKKELPDEQLKLAGIYKKPKASFFDVKGIIEALLQDLGINDVEFKKAESGAVGADVYIGHNQLGEIEVLEQNIIDFELDFATILKHASLKKVYKPTSKFPESVEDLRFEVDPDILYSKIEKTIKDQSSLVKNVSLLDVYQNKKTFRIVYQSQNHNLTNEEITELREKIIASLKKSFKAIPA